VWYIGFAEKPTFQAICFRKFPLFLFEKVAEETASSARKLASFLNTYFVLRIKVTLQHNV
jgi:hypothetical protein